MRFAAVLVGGLAAGCVQGLASPPGLDEAASEITGQTFGVPGEAMEYEVTLRGMLVGRLVVSVGKPGVVEGRKAIVVHSSGTSAGLAALFGDARWELTTTLDLANGLPLREVDERWVDIGGESDHRRNERAWSGASYNAHAAAGALRGWHSHEGQRASVEVMISDFGFGVELWEAAHEYLASARQPAVRYDGVARGTYKFSTWISDDEARVPLLLRTETKLGDVAVELVRYDPPVE